MLLAVVASFIRAIDGMLVPIVAAVAVVPIVALAPVLYTMFGSTSEVARILIASIAAFVPVFLNTLRGFRQVRPVHRDLMRVLRGHSAVRRHGRSRSRPRCRTSSPACASPHRSR